MNKETIKKHSVTRVTIILFAAIAVVAGVVIIFFQPTGRVWVSLARAIPYPALLMNYSYVRYSEYADFSNLAYSQDGDQSAFESGIGKRERILNMLIRKEALEQLAKKLGVRVEKNEIESAIALLVESAGSKKDYEQQIYDRLGLDSKQFARYVIQQDILMEKAGQAVSNDAVIQEEKRKIASDIYKRLAEGEDFSALASELSEDPSGAYGGDLGFVSKNTVNSAWADSIFSLSKGQISSVVETDDAYVIFAVDEIVETEAVSQAHVRMILIKKRGLNDVMQEYIKNSRIIKFLRIQKGK
ncbi:MAG: hypothetical protein ACD_76C00142G0008 [uncultured bacterium]|nr:MAG: hypothetical protein ACD_76C00142G0008 [uncultured bacterium]HBD05007.1 hypothetical protein [Candidatus Uhrbacteria bacterium]